MLPRVQDTTVVLYLMPDNPQDASKRPQVVFRSTLDSVGGAAYVPPKIEAPGSGDGAQYQGLINTGASGASGGKSPGGAAGGSAGAK